jgi:hypothetical protein
MGAIRLPLMLVRINLSAVYSLKCSGVDRLHLLLRFVY